MKNTPMLAMAACIAMLPLGGIADAQAEMPKRPNILCIHVDQLHWPAMLAYGNPHVKTPAMDRIAADGISFRASYAADPICCAARASWFTGRMSSEHGQASNGPYPVLKELPDLGGWLREHGGYETVDRCGKVPGKPPSLSSTLPSRTSLGRPQFPAFSE